jgi:hypothetical protein
MVGWPLIVTRYGMDIVNICQVSHYGREILWAGDQGISSVHLMLQCYYKVIHLGMDKSKTL